MTNNFQYGTQEWYHKLQLQNREPKPTKKVLITLHGGCFIEGNSTWDQEQTQCLRQLNPDQLHVYQLDFKKDNLSTALEDIAYQVKELKRHYSNQSQFYVLGRSSGGYLAKILFDCYPKNNQSSYDREVGYYQDWDNKPRLFEKAIYLAPVFNPLKRGQLIPNLGNKAQPFFKNQAEFHTLNFSLSNKELIFIPTHDENVPKECYTEHQRSVAQSLNIKTHSAMCKTISKEFQAKIKEFLDLN